MYVDSAYIAKYYVNEPDSKPVRRLLQESTHICSSALALTEVAGVFHRHVREGALSELAGRELRGLFRTHSAKGLWGMVGVSINLLSRAAAIFDSLPKSVPLRASDAIHLATAMQEAEPEIWTNDRHLLAAAPHVGLAGRSVRE